MTKWTMVTKDRITGIFCIAISALFAYNTGFVSTKQLEGDPGPRMFPYIGCIILAVCGIILIVNKHSRTKSNYFTKHEWRRASILFVIYLLYIILLWLFGFVVSSLIFLFIICFLFSDNRKSMWSKILECICFAIIVSGALYLIYITVFSTQMPKGFLWAMLGV